MHSRRRRSVRMIATRPSSMSTGAPSCRHLCTSELLERKPMLLCPRPSLVEYRCLPLCVLDSLACDVKVFRLAFNSYESAAHAHCGYSGRAATHEGVKRNRVCRKQRGANLFHKPFRLLRRMVNLPWHAIPVRVARENIRPLRRIVAKPCPGLVGVDRGFVGTDPPISRHRGRRVRLNPYRRLRGQADFSKHVMQLRNVVRSSKHEMAATPR